MSNLYTNPMQAGRDAFKNGKSIMDNPISKRTHANSALLWDMGYLAESTSEAKSTNLYDKVETYNFTCEAGPLELCTDWQALRAENAAQALLIASLKEDCEAGKRLLREQMALTTARTGEALFVAQQLSDTQRQNAELMDAISKVINEKGDAK
jgi:hypothetical protein